MDNLTTIEKKVINNTTRVLNLDVRLGDKVQGLIDVDNDLLDLIMVLGTPVNAVAAAMDLTFDGVVIDGEIVSIGDDVYEFLADVALSLTDPSYLPADISGYAVGSVVTLTIDTQVLCEDTMKLEDKEYIFVPDGTANADGEIDVGTDLATCKAAIVAAINGADSHNVAHPQVECADFISDDAILTVLVGGVAGDATTCTETFTEGTNIFSGATFASGADCVQANAVTALVVAITAFDTEGVGAVDGSGDVVELTADVAGVLGNAIVLAETCVNGAFTGAAVLMAGGVDGTVAVAGAKQMDSSYLYVALDDNTIADANWMRASISTF
jgi:hypothetical protein